MEKFRGNVEVLEFFYKQASLVLFLLSPNHLMSIGNSLYMLQLAIIDSNTREKLFTHVAQQIQLTCSTHTQSELQTTSPRGGLFSNIGRQLLDTLLMGCYSVLESNLTSMMYNENSKNFQDYNFGSSIYEKLFFVINKIGRCFLK